MDEEESLNNAPTSAGARFSERHNSWILARLGIVIALLFSVHANSGLSHAQTSGGRSESGANHVSAQQTVRRPEKKGKAAARQQAPSSATNSKNKSASKALKNQDSEIPFGARASSNRAPISIQSDSLAWDYKQNGVLFDGHVHGT